MALGSATEVSYLIELTHRLGFLRGQAYDECRNGSEALLPSLQKLLDSIERLE
jgi:hypothetical protein